MPLNYRKTVSVAASDVDSIALAQKPLGAGDLILTDTTVTVPNGGQYLSITSDGNDSVTTFTITGTDARGASQTWEGPGPNATTEEIALPFATVTEVSVGGATVGNVSVGWVAKTNTAPLPLDGFADPFNVSLTLQNFTGSGTPEATVWFTQNTVFGTEQHPATALADLTYFEHPTLIAQTSPGTGNFAFPVVATACYLDGNDQEATVDFIVQQTTAR